MRVLILGGGGMLGHKLWQVLQGQFETWVTLRSLPAASGSNALFGSPRVITGVPAEDQEKLKGVIDSVRPEVIINCIGLVKQLPEGQDPLRAIAINALFPHQLARMCERGRAQIIQISTDCVFSGLRGNYSEDDIPDPVDVYGRSKCLGELDAPHLTIRTSIIGPELGSANGLVEWFLSQPGPSVRGYTRAIFTGLPTAILAQRLSDLIKLPSRPTGLLHIASSPISKYDLLLLLRQHYNKKIEIEADAKIAVDRSLSGLRYRAIAPPFPSWDEMIAQMAGDARTHGATKGSHG